jgi:hypothetical protein
MNSVMMKAVVLALAVSCTSGALAKSGEVSVIHCVAGQVQNTATTPAHSFGIYNVYGTVRTDAAGGLFDLMSSECLGASRFVDGKPSVWGHCEWTDKDGDKVLLHFSRLEGLAGTFNVLHGTGKYSGLRGTRNYLATPFPSIAGARVVCDEGKLRYTLPDWKHWTELFYALEGAFTHEPDGKPPVTLTAGQAGTNPDEGAHHIRNANMTESAKVLGLDRGEGQPMTVPVR